MSKRTASKKIGSQFVDSRKRNNKNIEDFQENDLGLGQSDDETERCEIDNKLQVENDNLESGNQMNAVMEGFHVDLNKSLQAKKRRLELFMDQTFKKTREAVSEPTKKQYDERKKILDTYKTHFKAYMERIEKDIKLAKDLEAKLQKQIIQDQKHHQQLTIACQEHFKALNELAGAFFQNAESLESQHDIELEHAQAELKKEMRGLQKQMLMETQREGILNMKKSMQQTMMFM